MCTCLQHGASSPIPAAREALAGRPEPAQTMRAAIHDVPTHDAHRPSPPVHAEGGPLGSGVLDSGVRRSVTLRVKGARPLMGEPVARQGGRPCHAVPPLGECQCRRCCHAIQSTPWRTVPTREGHLPRRERRSVRCALKTTHRDGLGF